MLLQQIDKTKLLRIGVLFALLVLIVWLFFRIQLLLISGDLQALQKESDALQAEITSATKNRDVTNKEFETLKTQLEAKNSELNNAQKAQIYLQDLPMKLPLYAASNFLTQLEQIDSDLVWLKNISINQKGLRIEGMAETCTHIGPYSQKLGAIQLNGQKINISNLKIDYDSQPCQFIALEN